MLRQTSKGKVVCKNQRDEEAVWRSPVLEDDVNDLGDECEQESDSESNASNSSDDNLPIYPKIAAKAYKLAKQVYPAHGTGRRKAMAKKAKEAKAEKSKKTTKNKALRVRNADE